ncbi:hypothetical protein F2P81_008332 [Scophthalmus maximus]|uniref:Uncharacterized protein n=1 Tax=Scophthalmus maximus TaxID=52904 RepID=A0A6A4T203_SCOMX|nr:hypothetical protein F2P81_008332 [Scophthalmus maximus]
MTGGTASRASGEEEGPDLLRSKSTLSLRVFSNNAYHKAARTGNYGVKIRTRRDSGLVLQSVTGSIRPKYIMRCIQVQLVHHRHNVFLSRSQHDVYRSDLLAARVERRYWTEQTTQPTQSVTRRGVTLAGSRLHVPNKNQTHSGPLAAMLDLSSSSCGSTGAVDRPAFAVPSASPRLASLAPHAAHFPEHSSPALQLLRSVARAALCKSVSGASERARRAAKQHQSTSRGGVDKRTRRKRATVVHFSSSCAAKKMKKKKRRRQRRCRFDRRTTKNLKKSSAFLSFFLSHPAVPSASFLLSVQRRKREEEIGDTRGGALFSSVLYQSESTQTSEKVSRDWQSLSGQILIDKVDGDLNPLRGVDWTAADRQ